MALSDLQVYSEYAYETMTEIIQQQIDLFNGASAGAIRLSAGAHQGDFSQEAFYARVNGGILRRRNAYGSGVVAEKVLEHKEDVTVKVATGTSPIRIDPSQFRWILANPKEAGVILGRQLAPEVLADMLNIGLGAAYAALANIADVTLDVTADGDADNANKMSFVNMNRGQALFGDQSSRIGAWIMHSTPMHGLYGQNLTNVERLFTFGTVNVIRDPFGKLMLMSDSDSLFTDNAGTIDYHNLGLTDSAITLVQNDDFDANEETNNGGENIKRTYQAEWSFQAGLKGFAWDKENGGKSPNNAALLVASNWDQIYEDKKDLAGVVLNTRG